MRIWTSGRLRVEKHPFAGKYMALADGELAGIRVTLGAAQRLAAEYEKLTAPGAIYDECEHTPPCLLADGNDTPCGRSMLDDDDDDEEDYCSMDHPCPSRPNCRHVMGEPDHA